MSDSSNNRNTEGNSGNQPEIKPNQDPRYPLVEQSTELGSMYFIIKLIINLNYSRNKRNHRIRYYK